MASYLIKLTPLEPYFFGGERNFSFGKSKKETKPSYYIKSLEAPSQTTLLGALRYAVLAASNALITDYGDALQREKCKELVGKNSFSFAHEREYGKIDKIYPLFILENDTYYIPTPMNHNNDFGTYSPLHVVECKDVSLSCANGLYAEDYKAKKGCGGGWLKLDNGLEVNRSNKEHPLFSSTVRVGINAHRTDGHLDDKNSFFKKECKILNKGCFAFFADIDESVGDKLTGGMTVFLGQNKSAFRLEAEKRPNDLFEKIESALAGKSCRSFYYAIGDCYLTEVPEDMYIANTQLFRHLTTDYARSSFYYRINKCESLYKLVRAGAVFYTDSEVFAQNKNCQKIGMNTLIKIKGVND